MANQRRRAALGALAAALAPTVAAWGGVFDVRSFGAVGDGATLDTSAIRSAFAAAAAADGGEVLFPAGYNFLTGPFNFTSNNAITVAGTVTLTDDPSKDWPVIQSFEWFGPTDVPQFQPCLMGWRVSNVTLAGGGTINGNGSAWWPCAKDPSVAPCHGVGRPPALFFAYDGVGLTLRDVTIRDAPMWNLRPAFMDYVHVSNLTILAPPSTDPVNPSHNTDGVDPDCCRHVLVEDCTISVGDDAVAIKAGLDWWGRTYGRPSYNLTFRRLTVGTAHGLSIGSEMSAGVYDVLFEDITLTGAATGPRIKTQRGRGGYVANVTFRNLVLSGVGETIQLTEYYSASVPPQNASATPHFSNFTFDNVTATHIPGGKGSVGFYAAGLPESVMEGVTLRNVDFGAPAKPVGNCSYTTGVCEGTVQPACPPCLTPQ